MRQRKVILRIAVLSGLVLSGAGARAAVHYYFLPETGIWAEPENWDLEEVPGFSTSDTYAHVRAGRTAIIDSQVPAINRFQLGTTSQSGSLNVEDGASLYMAGAPDVGNGHGSAGYLTVSGGYLKCGSLGQNDIKVGVDSAGKSVTGHLVIRGGTLECQFVVGSSGVAGATPDVMRIEGDAATVFSTASQTYGPGLTLGTSAVLEFIFNQRGITRLNFPNTEAVFGPGSRMVVDGADYAGGGTFTLIKAASFSGSVPEITLRNFEAGSSHEWNPVSGTFKVMAMPKATGLFFAIHSNHPYEIQAEFIEYIKSATNPEHFGLRDDGRFYPYSPPGGRRIAYRQMIPDKALYLQGWSPEEAEAQLRRELEATVAALRPVILQKARRSFDGLPADSQEILLDFAYSEGVARLSDRLIAAAISLDWETLLDPSVYSRNEADWPDSSRNRAFYTRWQAKGGSQ